MTREERRRHRRSNIITAICIGVIAIWITALLLICNANAAYEGSETTTEPDKLTLVLTIIGALWTSWQLMQFIQWLDNPRKKVDRRTWTDDTKSDTSVGFGHKKPPKRWNAQAVRAKEEVHPLISPPSLTKD